jgi:hypothetical protein
LLLGGMLRPTELCIGGRLRTTELSLESVSSFPIFVRFGLRELRFDLKQLFA